MKKFYEKDLEEIIFNASYKQLEERGLNIEGTMFRQIQIGKYGRLDLMTVKREFYEGQLQDKYLDITIYELKEDKIGIGAFLQAIGYAKGIKEFMNLRGYDNYTLNIVLIGGDIDLSGNFCFLADLFNNTPISYLDPSITSINFYTYKYDINGISFKQESDYTIS